MKRSRFTEEQMVGILKEQEAGRRTAVVNASTLGPYTRYTYQYEGSRLTTITVECGAPGQRTVAGHRFGANSDHRVVYEY